MPPKKRKATTAAAPDPAAVSPTAASARPARKKVRIGDQSVIDDDDNNNSRASTPGSARLRRSTSNDNPRYNFTNTRGGKRGAAAGRGAAAKAAVGGKAASAAAAAVTTATKKKPGKGRGRPPKTVGPVEPEPEDENEDEVDGEGEGEDEGDGNEPPVKKATAAGRKGILKNKNPQSKVVPEVEVGVNGASASAPARRGRGKPVAAADPKAKPEKKGGRPAKKPNLEELDGLTDEEALNKGASALLHESVDPEIQYWLMKAEPESRIEKGVDVKFSIDDLAAKTEPEGWDGVRNPVARNNMRAMRVNDLAFFYHSNCKKPAIVGVMRVVEEHSVDESAFDPDHPYYDPKSDRAKPKWELVKVEFVKKFETEIGLKELRSYAKEGGALANMQTLKQSRLSVSAVSPQEWRFILQQAGVDVSLGQPSRSGGYEGDTDGEAEAHEAEEGKLPPSSFEVTPGAVGVGGVEGERTEDEAAGSNGDASDAPDGGKAAGELQTFTTVSLGDGHGADDLS